MKLTSAHHKFISEAIGPKYSANSVPGGSTHHVFQIDSASGVYYLKVRGHHYSLAPAVLSEPSDISYEVESLKLLHSIDREMFPQLIDFAPDISAFLMSSVMDPEDLLIRRISEGNLAITASNTLGAQLALIHQSLASTNHSPRSDDGEFYKTYIFNHITSLNYRELEGLQAMLSRRPRQLIFGDLSPKNIGIASGEMRFIDFDSMHCGHRDYEIGFVAGHLLLHAIIGGIGTDHYYAFLAAYSDVEPAILHQNTQKVIAHSVLATLIYRLDNKWVEYPIDTIDPKQKTIVLETIKDCLKDSVALAQLPNRLIK